MAERTAVNREAIGSNPIRSAYTRLAQSVERWPFKPVAEGSSPSAGGRALLDNGWIIRELPACICLAQLVERTTLNRVVRGSTPRVDALFFVLLGMSGDLTFIHSSPIPIDNPAPTHHTATPAQHNIIARPIRCVSLDQRGDAEDDDDEEEDEEDTSEDGPAFATSRNRR